MIFKYVMMQYTFSGVKYHYPILFPENLVHAKVAEAQRNYWHGPKEKAVHPKPVSAGSVEITPDGAHCFGKSESLKMEPHHDDDTLMNLGISAHALFPR